MQFSIPRVQRALASRFVWWNRPRFTGVETWQTGILWSTRSSCEPSRLARPPSVRAVLDESCGDDIELRRKVEALLMVHDGAGSFLEHPAPGLVAARSETSGEVATLPLARSRPRSPALRIDEKTEPFGPNSSSSDNPVSRPLTEGPGTRIGPYKLLQQIGEGGMGVVYMAEQEQPVRRKVALKIIKPGMDTAPGRRPVRGRAAGPGPDGPPQHRQGPRRRRHRQPAAPSSSWSWSRASRSPSTATRPSSPRASGWSCSSPSARRSSTRTRRGSSTATSSRRTCW